MQYVGQTGRSLKTRFCEHFRKMKKPKKFDTFLYRHFKNNGHSPSKIEIQPVEKIIYDPNSSTTVKLWSLELACLEHQGSLELVRRSRQFLYTFNDKIYPRLEQRWLELSNSKHGPYGDFSCKNAMMARTKYFFT